MSTDPRAALDRLVAAFEAHLEAARTSRDPDAEGVVDAAATLADAFDTYDDALFTAFGVDTPFDVYDDEDDEDDDDFEDDDEDDDED
ncbi:DNA primase [Serinibacter arcticus]|uniref:DNA primase n=1 Tax=Serinibacter arcticus TaxID=1655435 RepID=UPI0018EE762A|nr:DNA primase [Serinibacter arcticus]